MVKCYRIGFWKLQICVLQTNWVIQNQAHNLFWIFSFIRRSATVEAVVLLVLAIAIIPANVLGIVKFYKRKLNQTFFALVTALCCCNVAMGVIGILIGLARYMDKHPMEKFGCLLTSIGVSSISTATLYIQAIISYERRKVITQITIHRFHFRVYIMLAFVTSVSVIFWTIFSLGLGAITYNKVQLDQNSTDTIEICATASLGLIGLPEMIFSVFGFMIPANIVVYNYWYVSFPLFNNWAFTPSAGWILLCRLWVTSQWRTWREGRRTKIEKSNIRGLGSYGQWPG